MARRAVRGAARRPARPAATLGRQLRRLHGPGAPYSISSQGTLTTLVDEHVHAFHGDAALLDASGRPVRGCRDATVDAFTMPPPEGTGGGDHWGVTVDLPPTCTVSAGAYQEGSPAREPAALSAWG